MSKYKKFFCMFLILLLAVCLLSTTAFAAGTGDVAGAIEGTWNDASDQIKTVVNNVVFPVIDLILAVFFFAKLGMAYFDYRKHGHPLCLPLVHADRPHLCVDHSGDVSQ